MTAREHDLQPVVAETALAEGAAGEAEALFQLIAAVNGAEGLEAIYEAALAAITRLLRVDRASILLYDDAGVMRFRAWRGLSEAYRRAVDGHSPWRREDTDARPILVGDVTHDESLREYLPVFAAEGIRALGFVPLLHRARLLGKFMLYSDRERTFGAREVRLAETVAGQIAQAVARAQLYADERQARAQLARRAQQQEALADLGRRALESSDLGGLLEELTRAATDVLGADFAAVMERTADSLRLRAGVGWSAEVMRRHVLPDDPGLLASFALRADGVVIADDLRREERFPTSSVLLAEGAVSALVAAIPTSGGRFGVLGVFARRAGAFTADDAQFVRGLTNVVGAALDRAAAERAVAEASRRKDEFLALLGHELRNPLSPILTALHLMALKGEGNIERERQVIERQVVHLNRLVDDLLDVSRITRGMLPLETAPHALRRVVLRAIEMASPLLEERAHELVTELPRDLWVFADPERLAQVIANLLTNAAKYTPPGGRVEVRARRAGDLVAVTVQDNGRGIPAAALPHLFEPFFQVERTLERGHGGLGLGLALVRSLVELHGGSVEATSEGPGLGSAFTVRIPAAPAELEAVMDETGAIVVQRPLVDPARVRRVLVVDDIRDVAEGLAEVLRAHGHEVVVCLDGPKALVTASRFEFDVALLDIGLPVMDGFELARQLRAAGRRGALVAVTGYGQDLDRARTQAAGFAEHLTKPVTAAQLLAAVDAQPRLLPPLEPAAG